MKRLVSCAVSITKACLTADGWLRLMVALGAFSLIFALYFQYVEDMKPCILCLYQRIPYIAVMILSAGAVLTGKGKRAVIWLSIPIFLLGAAIAGYQTGLEYGWWQDVLDCTGPASTNSVEALLKSLNTAEPVDCSVVQWSLFGISMAGYNTLLSFGLAAASLVVLRKKG